MKKSSKPIMIIAEIPPRRKLPAQAIMSMAFLHLWHNFFRYCQFKSANYRGQLGETLFSLGKILKLPWPTPKAGAGKKLTISFGKL
jgi:hypothetical protein